MDNNIIETTRKHGREMNRLALVHSLEMAKLYRDYGENPIEQLIEHLEKKVKEAEVENGVL